MVKKMVYLAFLFVFIFSSVSAFAEEAKTTRQPLSQLDVPTKEPITESPKDRISRGVNNIFYGPMEVANNMDETKTKGTAVYKCNQKTRSGVERGIARVFTGVWQLATFWNSDPGCVTKAPAPDGTKQKTK